MGDFRDFVRFDVRPAGDAVPVQISLQPVDVSFHLVQVNHSHRGVKLIDVHRLLLLRSIFNHIAF